MMEDKQFICINCPMGCHLKVTVKDGQIISVTGNTCRRGEIYARQEAIAPRRVLTCLMRTANRQKPISVKTSQPVPKAMLFECVNEVYATRPKAPIKMGQVVIKNICGTGADILSTQNMG